MDKKLRENIILNSLYQILAIFVPLITAPYLGRILKADQIGTYTYVHSIVGYDFLNVDSLVDTIIYATKNIEELINIGRDGKKEYGKYDSSEVLPVLEKQLA